MKQSTHRPAAVAQDGFPQRAVHQDLVVGAHELAGAAVQRALRAGPAGRAPSRNAPCGQAAAADAQARPGPAGLGVG